MNKNLIKEYKLEGLKIAIKRLEIERDSWLIIHPEDSFKPGTIPSFCRDVLQQAIRNINEIDIPSIK